MSNSDGYCDRNARHRQILLRLRLSIYDRLTIDCEPHLRIWSRFHFHLGIIGIVMENSRIVIREKYYVFLIFLVLLDSVFGEEIYGEFNGNITLRPGLTGTIKEILWKHNGDKAAEYNRPDPVQSFRDFQRRVILNTTTGHLTITNLNQKDNGEYKAESQLDEIQQLQYYTVNLAVLEAITMPTVRCKKNETTASLLCSAEGPDLQYSWEGGNISPPTWSPEPTELVISEKDDPHWVYNCRVKSKASSQSSEAYKAAECFAGSSHSLGIIIGVSILVAVVLVTAIYCICRRRNQGTNKNYQEVHQYSDIESNVNMNQDPSSSSIYTRNTSHEIEEGTKTGTGERKALSGSKMNDIGLKDREKQTHETERVPNQEGKGNAKYIIPCEVKDDRKPNHTFSEKEDLLQKGTTQRDVKQEEKKIDPPVVNKDKNEVKKINMQVEDKDQKEEEKKIDSQKENKDRKEEKKTDPQAEDKDQKEEEKKTDPQEEVKDQKKGENKIDPREVNKDQIEEEKETDPQKEDKHQKEEEKKTDSQEEDKDQKEEEKTTDPQEEDKDQKEEEKKTDPQEEDKDQKEEEKTTDPQEEDKDQKEEEKKTDPQEEDKDQKKGEKKIIPREENKDQKEEEKNIDLREENKDQKEEEKNIDLREENKDQKEEDKKTDPQEEDKDQKEEEKKTDPQVGNKDQKEEEKKTDPQVGNKDQKREEKQEEINKDA